SRESTARSVPLGKPGQCYFDRRSSANGVADEAGAGNLTKRIAAGVTTLFEYDALSRLDWKKYSDDTPKATFCHDGQTYDDGTKSCAGNQAKPLFGRTTGIGTYDSVRGDAGTTVVTTSYDALGRPLTRTQKTGTVTAPLTGHTYNVDGSIATTTLPTRTLQNCYDLNGRLIWVSQTLACQATNPSQPANASDAYAAVQFYAPQGAPRQILLGNGLTETTAFNVRLQPDKIALMAGAAEVLAFENPYSDAGNGINNNGNVIKQKIHL